MREGRGGGGVMSERGEGGEGVMSERGGGERFSPEMRPASPPAFSSVCVSSPTACSMLLADSSTFWCLATDLGFPPESFES